MDKTREKIIKSSRVMATIAKVLFIAMVICALIPVGLLTYIGFNRTVDITHLAGFSLTSMDGRQLESTGEVVAQMCTILVGVVFLSRVYYCVYRMFRSINESQSPFCNECIRRLKKVSVVLIVYSLVMPVVEAGFTKTFAPELSLRLTPDSVSILMALIVLFISFVFQYGAQLQKQSDETL